MKKIMFSLSAVLMTATAAFAQNSKVYKAADLLDEAEQDVETRDAKYAEALNNLTEAFQNPKTKKLAFAYHLAGEVESRKVNVELEKMKVGKADTSKFITCFEKAIEYFTKSNEVDQTPNDKGKVKVECLNKFRELGGTGNQTYREYSGNKKRIIDMLKYNGQVASFMLARKDQDGALKYLIKDLEMPTHPVFTKAETDSIYKADAAHYNQIGYFVAMLYNDKKDYDNILKYVDYAIKSDKSRSDGYLMKTGALLAKGDTAQWVETCKKAIEDMPENVNYCEKLLTYYAQKKLEAEATAMAKDLVQKDPESKVAWYASGSVNLNQFKKYAEARADFDKALEKDPNFVEALYNKGVSYVNELISLNLTTDTSSKDYQKTLDTAKEYYGKALPLFEKVRELAPSKMEYWAENLRSCYYNLDMKDKAKEMEDLIAASK
ncbi:MAG: hypothetical protein IJ244_04695 [Bacteroidaceae bacterium]|nr:hypothetical protein [Bacteroidaceae bacterium]